MSDLAGQTIGKYRLIEKLGAGGMAQVYKAYQPGLDRYVAIKFIRPELAIAENFLVRFEQEAKAIARLSHGNIVHVYDFGEEDYRYYLVMEFVEGSTVKDRLQSLSAAGTLMPLGEVISIIQQVSEALDYAHRQGIIHRDVKPDNILLTADGRAVLNDFGIAKIVEAKDGVTSTGMAVGTPAYMAPEQIEGGKGQIGPASDLYSLGIILYEMVTGQPPFIADTPLAIMLKHLSDPIPLPRTLNPSLPQSIERVIFKALARAPADRYQNAGHLVEALRQALVEAPTSVEMATPTLAASIEEKDQAQTVESARVPEVRAASPPLAEPTVTPAEKIEPFWRKAPLWVWGVFGGVFLLIVVGGILLAGSSLPFWSGSAGHITFGFDNRVYRVEAREEAIPEDVSQALDKLSPGAEDDWLNISPDGEWLLLNTDRFEPECDGWPCLVLVSGDLSAGNTIFVDWEVIHPHGFGAVASGGNLIVFSREGGPHETDLWVVVRSKDNWTAPLLLTGDSPYTYHYWPAISADGSRMVFNCSEVLYGGEGTAICEAGTDGTGFRVVLTPVDGPTGTSGAAWHKLQSPHYMLDGSIIFDANWEEGSNIWRLPAGATEPVQVKAKTRFGSEGSPCVLPDGRLVTVKWFEEPEGFQIRVTTVDGSSHFIIPTDEAVDYYIGCGE